MSIKANCWAIGIAATLTVLVLPVSADTGDSFSFAIIADPHVSGGSGTTSAQRLQLAVDWLNGHRHQEDVELVFVVGDIGWGNGAATARSILDGLAVPYAPLIGDNEIHATGDAMEFQNTYAPVFQSLEALAADPNTGFSNWQKAPGPVWNPEIGDLDYFQNYGFDYRGVNFACLDWVTRNMSTGFGEHADLHDFPGGTFPWFTDYIAGCPKDKEENTVMLTHHPMFTLGGWIGEIVASLGAFGPGEFEKIGTFLTDPNHDYGRYVYADYAGHLHSQGYLPEDVDPNWAELTVRDYHFDPNDYDPNGPIQLLPLPGYDMYIVDDTHIDPVGSLDDPISLEIVRVTEGDTSFSYDSQAVFVPEPSTLAVFGLAILAVWRRPPWHRTFR